MFTIETVLKWKLFLPVWANDYIHYFLMVSPAFSCTGTHQVGWHVLEFKRRSAPLCSPSRSQLQCGHKAWHVVHVLIALQKHECINSKKESSRICGVNFDSPKSVTTVVAVEAIVLQHVQDSNEKEFY